MQKKIRTVAVGILTTLALSSSAMGVEECPVNTDTENPGDAIIAAIEAANSCYKAASIAESCAFGSGVDVYTVGAAAGVCSKNFPEPMPAKDKVSFDHLIEKCYKKFENEEGSMYRSASAFCALDVYKLFNNLYSPVD